MKNKTKNTKSSNNQRLIKRLAIWALVVAWILMIPLLRNWPWTKSDYVFASILLFGSATTYELITKNMKDPGRRLVVGVIVFLVLAIIWVGAATGFGQE